MQNIEKLKDLIIKCLEDRKAADIVAIDLQGKTELAKYIIFASGTSTKNIASTAEYISLELKHGTDYKIIIEGLNKSNWVLIDAGEIIVHLFHPEMREQLKLEEKYK
jgi:ribosome-associated protein